MVNMMHTPGRYYEKSYTIEGDNIEELLKFCLDKIRPQSNDYYKKYLKESLETEPNAIIDQHAGMGNFYTVKLIK